ncbi:restriction endonuclease subunit S [Vibrio parahaemolyticus]|nr:restriction endonuclease subunit S [Vibrio parahaemolyticus]
MVPSGWKLKTLSDITKEKVSYGIVQAGPHVSGGVPYLKSADVGGEIDIDSLQKTAPEIHHKYRRSAVHPGDIVFSLRGNIGRMSIVPNELIEANLTQGTARISVDENNDSKYIYYQIASTPVLNRINALSKGSTFKEISLEELRKVKVACAPLQEQQKIAKILSTWDNAISTTEKLIANNKQQKKALMQQLLTGKKRLIDPETGTPFSGEWVDVHMGDICQINPKKPPEPENGLISFIPMDAVSEDAKLLRTETKSYSEVSKGFTSFKELDVLIAKITPCFENGKGAQVTQLENGIGFGSTEFHVLRAKSGISAELVYFLTNDKSFRVRGELNMQGSAGQKRVTTDYLKLCKVFIPKQLTEQQKIASVLTAADKEIELLETKLAHFKQEKKALMQQLLTGKRRVNIAA